MPTGNGKKLCNSQACFLAQLCLAAAYRAHNSHSGLTRYIFLLVYGTVHMSDTKDEIHTQHDDIKI